MVDKRNSTQNSENHLPKPIFDASASARARPVEPLQPNEAVDSGLLRVWRNRFDTVTNFLGSQTRALAIVVVIGLITGSVGGVLLVNAARSNEQPVMIESFSSDSASSQNETERLDAFASKLTAATSTSPTIERKAKGRFKSNKPRAYRVAIIR